MLAFGQDQEAAVVDDQAGVGGAADKILKLNISPFFCCLGIWHTHILLVMNSKPTPQSLLNDIAQIQRLDRGTVSVLRQGPQGPYYNHQCYEKGRNVSATCPPNRYLTFKQPSMATVGSRN